VPSGIIAAVKVPFLLVLLCVAVAFGQDLQIRGEVTDSEGAVVRGATIRLLGEQTRLTLYRCKADEYGRFEFDGVTAGRYMIAASAPGFRERLLLLGSPQAERKIVRIRLEVLGCDAPGVNCDIFSTGPYTELRPIRSKGYLQLRVSDAVDLDRGGSPDSSGAADVAVQIRSGAGLYLTPLNGARIAQIGETDSNCGRGKYQRQAVRVDGLGPGSDICVITNGGSRSHLFITEEISATSAELKIYYVTRMR
jgi:hypothetical protein